MTDELPSPAHSFDARLWAESFVAHVAKYPGIPTDEGTMLGWFASALMRGFDEAQRRRDVEIREFIGWLSGEIPELHHVEVPRLAAAYQRFQNTRDPDSAESLALVVRDVPPLAVESQATCPECGHARHDASCPEELAPGEVRAFPMTCPCIAHESQPAASPASVEPETR